MPQTGRAGVVVQTMLERYRERARAERKRTRHANESPPALFPVSFAMAKDWVLDQLKAESEALQAGAVNPQAQQVCEDLSRSLAEKPRSAVQLFQAVSSAALIVPLRPSAKVSEGPELVTEAMRAEERAASSSKRGTRHQKVGKVFDNMFALFYASAMCMFFLFLFSLYFFSILFQFTLICFLFQRLAKEARTASIVTGQLERISTIIMITLIQR